LCTLCRCKFPNGPRKPKNVVELAEHGDWIGIDTFDAHFHFAILIVNVVDPVLEFPLRLFLNVFDALERRRDRAVGIT
jgi:hypothetical protein